MKPSEKQTNKENEIQMIYCKINQFLSRKVKENKLRLLFDNEQNIEKIVLVKAYALEEFPSNSDEMFHESVYYLFELQNDKKEIISQNRLMSFFLSEEIEQIRELSLDGAHVEFSGDGIEGISEEFADYYQNSRFIRDFLCEIGFMEFVRTNNLDLQIIIETESTERESS